MTRALGLRATPSEIYWAVVEGTRTAPTLVAHDKVVAPADLHEGAVLSWYRDKIRLIIEMYAPSNAGVRTAEPIARGGNTQSAKRRLRAEGVLLEVVNSYGVSVSTNALATIASKLGTKDAKSYVDSGSMRGLDLSEIPKLSRESVLVAVAALSPR